MTNEFSLEQEAAAEKILKMLALARSTTHEGEAEAAMAAAQRLSDAYNLSLLVLSNSKIQKREDKRLKGGLYPWQRYVWDQTAKLNFCRYFFIRGLQKGQAYEHQIIGSIANVKTTEYMAEYLQDAIERHAREWAKEKGLNIFCKSAISYRDGMSNRICQKLMLRREEVLAEEKKRKEEAERNRPAGSGRELVLMDVIDAENDANDDHLYGEGYSARRRADRARAEAEYQARLEAEAKWRRENPEAAAAKDKAEKDAYERLLKDEAKKAARRKGVSRMRDTSYKGDRNAYWAGHAKGADVGIDRQVAKNTMKGIK
jgi:hypothetical protein